MIRKPLFGLVAALFATATTLAHADIRITEVAPWASGNSPYATDWFELTNTGSSNVNISGWKIDDSSAAFGAALALTGITTINAGESVIFFEGSAGNTASFLTTWFGGSVPAGLQVGSYAGSGVGLSTGGDAVNIYNAGGVLQASVSFASADGSSPYQTFDNAAGLNNVAISQLSTVGVNGAHIAANDIGEIGSPGTIAAVPEPEQYALLLAGLGMIGAVVRKRQAQ